MVTNKHNETSEEQSARFAGTLLPSAYLHGLEELID